MRRSWGDKVVELKRVILASVDKARQEIKDNVKTLCGQLSGSAESSRSEKRRCILKSLDFETRQTQQSDIAEIEDKTSSWIYSNYHGPQKTPVGLSKWLQLGNGIHWISGKPGSGRSVLMKYVAEEVRTRTLLRSWVGNTKLLIAIFFFWNAGAPMQKSQQSLLQSLLREIYGHCPDLISSVCPRWGRFYDIGMTWTREELFECFKELKQSQSLSLKFCFLIDGVDEYEGSDHADIIGALNDLNASPFVKICLSSRPWNIFIAAFGSDTSQRIILEDNNEEDIKIYINSRFETDR